MNKDDIKSQLFNTLLEDPLINNPILLISTCTEFIFIYLKTIFLEALSLIGTFDSERGDLRYRLFGKRIILCEKIELTNPEHKE